MLDEQVVPTRVLPALRDALVAVANRSRPLVVALDPDAPVSHVRAVLASAAGTIRMIVTDDHGCHAGAGLLRLGRQARAHQARIHPHRELRAVHRHSLRHLSPLAIFGRVADDPVEAKKI